MLYFFLYNKYIFYYYILGSYCLHIFIQKYIFCYYIFQCNVKLIHTEFIRIQVLTFYQTYLNSSLIIFIRYKSNIYLS